MYLIIDTSTRTGAVGVWRDGSLVRALTWSSRNNHTSELMPAVKLVLGGAGISPTDLRGVAVANGPGGFSALRAGLGAAKGLAFAVGLPAVGVSTLEATAYPYRDAGYPICALIEAGRDLVGWARFQLTADGWRRRSPDRVTAPGPLRARAGRHTLFCGEGAAVFADALLEVMGARAHIVTDVGPTARLQGVAELGASRLDAGDTDSLAALRPHYLRPPGITPPKQPRAVSYGAAPARA